MIPTIPRVDPLVLCTPIFQGCGYEEPRSIDDDLMFGDGEEFDDDIYNVTPLPLTSVAGVLQPSDATRAYIFCGNRYVGIKVIPGTPGDMVPRSSNIIVDDWPSKVRTKFAGRIDAILPVPNNQKCMYFFSMESYALIDTQPASPLTGTANDGVIAGPKNIVCEWAALKAAGFKTTDAIFPDPLNNKHAFFFSGDHYVLINVQQGPNRDHIVDGPKPIWSCIKEAGFKEIVMILQSPTSSNEAYKTNIMLVRMYRIPTLSTLSTGQRRSALNGPRCERPASGEG